MGISARERIEKRRLDDAEGGLLSTHERQVIDNGSLYVNITTYGAQVTGLECGDTVEVAVHTDKLVIRKVNDGGE